MTTGRPQGSHPTNTIIMKKYLIILVLLFVSLEILAQKSKNANFVDDTIINYIPRYEYSRYIATKAKHIYKFDVTSQLNIEPTRPKGTGGHHAQIKGFRIQVYQGKERIEATETREKCFEYFEKYHPYLQFKRPTYDVCLGDFQSKKDARKMLKKVKKQFKNAIIISDMIWHRNIPVIQK